MAKTVCSIYSFSHMYIGIGYPLYNIRIYTSPTHGIRIILLLLYNTLSHYVNVRWLYIK